MKLKHFKILISAAFFCICAFQTVSARCLKVKASRSTGTPELVCDSIDFRSDLTRVYGRLIGTPHTSHRIDGVKMTPGGVYATDIDGVDFKRYFQWEDDGEIAVEIDFPAMKERPVVVMEAITPRESAVWTVETLTPKIKRRKAKK